MSLASSLEQKHPSVEALRRLSTLQELDRKQLTRIAAELVVRTAGRGTRLLVRGATDTATLFLLQGTLKLIAADGAVTRIGHKDRSASRPVARLRPSQYDVIAESAVEYLAIDGKLLQEYSRDAVRPNAVENYEVREENEIDGISWDNKLSMRLWQDLNNQRLLLPSLPDVAIRVGRAVADEDSDVRRIADLVAADPAISTKLMKAANSPRYGGVESVRTVHDAVVRLGLQTTHHLVITFALRELFRCDSAVLQRRMTELWVHSRRVAAVSHVLARKLKGFDPEFALVAGLVHDIGAVAVISYAKEFPELSQDERGLEAVIGHLRGQVGKMLIDKWKLPAELATVTLEAENWQRDPVQSRDYTDLVIIAQLHSFVGTSKQSRAPAINQVPAHRRLDLGKLTPEASLQLLEEAREEILQMEKMLGS